VDSHDPDRLLLRLVTEALEAWGLSPRQLAPLVDAHHSAHPMSALLDAAAMLTDNQTLGIELAYATTIRALSPVVYLMMSGPTLGAALRDMTQYASVAVHRPTTAALLVEKQTTTFLFGPETGGRTYSEYLAALLVRLFRYIVDDPQLRPIAARFTHSTPSDLRARNGIFGEDLTYDQPRNGLVFSAEQVAQPCVHASTALHALHERALYEALQAELQDSLLLRVREAISDGLLHNLPTMKSVSRAVGLSERTLQRRLQERGTSFERLLQEVRRQRTLQLLSQCSLSIESVAHETGYRDASSLHRAFRAWTGVTPAVYRARLQGAADADLEKPASDGSTSDGDGRAQRSRAEDKNQPT
jgi:AraC-like DNA-binding protein